MENQTLQTQTNLKTSLKQLEIQEIGYNIKPSLVIAMQRLEMELNNIEETIEDIYSEFGYLNLTEIKNAIRNGSLGKYGRTFKLNTQEVCFWINQYVKEKNSKTLQL
jgi:hypothetical protein